MRKVIVLITGLFSLMMVSLVTARGIGRSQPEAASVRRWHLADCALPCWGGFVIRDTPAAETEDRLRELFPPPAIPLQLDSWDGVRNVTMQLKQDYNGAVVDQGSVTIAFADQVTSSIFLVGGNLPRLGDLFEILGPPSCVLPGRVLSNTGVNSKGTNSLILKYIDVGDKLAIEFLVSAPQWAEPINYMAVYEISVANPCGGGVRWHGLIDARRYVSELAAQQ